MNQSTSYQKRIGWEGDIKPLLIKVCQDYNIGNYKQHIVVPVGYEDFNLIVDTNRGKYFFKFFAQPRNQENCQRYIEIMQQVIKAGIKHPHLYESSQGYLYNTQLDNVSIRLCVMQYIDGKNLYDLNEPVSLTEIPFYAQQISLIHKIDLIPNHVYDSWAISSFPAEYDKTKKYLDTDDKALLEQLLPKFLAIKANDLPHCLVHGDIIKTNVLRDKERNLYFLDCSVANYSPRIQELAVLCCNILFDENNPASFTNYYNLLFSEYQKYITLTAYELSTLPVYIQAAHATHVIRPVYEKIVNGNHTTENEYWLKVGKIGLKHTMQQLRETNSTSK